jgi:hypothetical protein
MIFDIDRHQRRLTAVSSAFFDICIGAATPDEVYAAIARAWDAAGLKRRRVFDTPGYEAAVEALDRRLRAAGWVGPLIGPGANDTWPNFVHILAHKMLKGQGHILAHAKLELELVELAIAVLGAHRNDA